MSNTNSRTAREYSRSETTEHVETEDELVMERGNSRPTRPTATRTIRRTATIRDGERVRNPKHKGAKRLIL